MGGPIKKEKTFFYADYEGLQEDQGVTTGAFVPSAAVRGIGTGPGGGTGPSIECSRPVAGSNCTTQTLMDYLSSRGEHAVFNPDPVTGMDKAVAPFLGLRITNDQRALSTGAEDLHFDRPRRHRESRGPATHVPQHLHRSRDIMSYPGERMGLSSVPPQN